MTENIGTFGDYGQPDFADYPSTEPESKHPVLTALNETITRLERELAEKETYRANVADQLRSIRYDHDKKKLALKDVLISLVEEEDLHYDNAKTIAEIFDIVLTKRIEIEYKIVATTTIEVPINADEDDVASEVYCDRVDFSCYNSDYEVLETDYDVEDWNVRS